MKKIISLILAAIMSLNLVACGGDVKTVKASDEEKQAVITAAQKCLDSDEFKSAVELYESTFETEANTPEIINALTFKYDNYEGMAVDFILFNVKADVGTVINEVFSGYDAIQFVVDRTTGTVYNSLTLQQKVLSMPIPILTTEDAAAMVMCSRTLRDNTSDWVYSEMEESTRFTSSDIKEINAAINK